MDYHDWREKRKEKLILSSSIPRITFASGKWTKFLAPGDLWQLTIGLLIYYMENFILMCSVDYHSLGWSCSQVNLIVFDYKYWDKFLSLFSFRSVKLCNISGKRWWWCKWIFSKFSLNHQTFLSISSCFIIIIIRWIVYLFTFVTFCPFMWQVIHLKNNKFPTNLTFHHYRWEITQNSEHDENGEKIVSVQELNQQGNRWL